MGCSNDKNLRNLENFNIQQQRVDMFFMTIENVFQKFENGEFDINSCGFMIKSAFDKVSDLFETDYEDCVVTSAYIPSLISEEEAYLYFENTIQTIFEEYKNGLHESIFYRNLVMACKNLDRDLQPKGYAKVKTN